MLGSQIIRFLIVVNLLAAAVLIYQWRDAQVNALAVNSADRVGLVETSILLASEVPPPSGNVKKRKRTGLSWAQDEPVAMQQNPDSGGSAEPGCVKLGPYFSVSKARTVAKSVGLVGYRIESEDFTDEKVDYRVHLAPAKSIEEAYRTRKLLQSSNIDSFVMTDGPLARGVSLGVFSSRASAESFRHQSSISVYNPVVTPISRVQRSHWLKLDPQDPVKQDKLIAQIISQSPAGSVSAQVLCH
jgi:hypothetical protein